MYIYICMHTYIHTHTYTYIRIYIHMYIYIYINKYISSPVERLFERLDYEQALVCISYREIFDASTGCTCHCKMANNRSIAVLGGNRFGHLLSRLAAFNYNGLCTPSSALAVEFCYSETRACSWRKA